MKGALAVAALILLLVGRYTTVAQTGELKSFNFTNSVPRIAGVEAPVGRFPYVCSLLDRVSERHVCGGTLFRQKWVVTAAHCINPSRSGTVGRNPLVYCGIHDLSDYIPELTFSGVAAHMYDSWTGDVNEGYDIAVIELDREANVTLPVFDRQGGEFRYGQAFTAMAENLINLPPQRCRKRFGIEFEKMICAGLMYEDTCEGDSGSPLLIPNKPDGNLTAGRPERDLVIGVTSFGSKDCNGSSPAVYLSIGYFWDWLTRVADGKVSKEEDAVPDVDDANETIQSQPSEDEIPPSSLEDISTHIDYNTPGSDGAPEMIHSHLSEEEMPPSSLEDNSTRIDYNTPGSDGAPEMIHSHLSEEEMPPSSLEDISTRIDYGTPGSDGAPEMIHSHLSEEILSLIEDDYLDIEYSTPDGDSASQGAVNLNMLAVIIVLLWY